MVSSSSPLFSSTSAWPLEDPISQEFRNVQNLCLKEIETCVSSLHFPPYFPKLVDQVLTNQSQTFGSHNSLKVVKRLSHNASERDRRKKINVLYSSLRSLLPNTDQMDGVSNSKERPKLRMMLRSTQAKLDAFRGRYRDAGDEVASMDSKYEVASATLKERPAYIGLRSLPLDATCFCEWTSIKEHRGKILNFYRVP